MKILHTVESYLPARHGMSEVVRQISEGLVRKGHEVWVATSRDPRRKTGQIRGVKIREFSVFGKSAFGIYGEAETYQRFLLESDAEVIVNFAAQQWATDLMLPLLDRIRAKKILVPTGFSALGDPRFADYFSSMKDWMKKYDACVFLSDDYRDIHFARQAGVRNRVLIPNGAAREEFDRPPGAGFKKKLGIPDTHSLVIHVSGYLSSAKGQLEAIRIFSRSRVSNATLLIISGEFADSPFKDFGPRKLFRGLWYFFSGKGASGFFLRRQIGILAHWFRLRNLSFGRQIRMAALSRKESVDAFQAADLLLFPSWIECSPLVLFEAVAARTPFLVTDVGNAREIIAWTGGGKILPGRRLADLQGSVVADVTAGAEALDRFWGDPRRRQAMARSAHRAWRKHFTWEKITSLYEGLYGDLLRGRRIRSRPAGLLKVAHPARTSAHSVSDPKKNPYWRITGESLVLLAAQALTLLGSLAGIRILTHYLDPAEMGRLALGLTAGTFANQLLFGPLANGATRFFAPAQQRGELKSYFSALGRLFFRAILTMGLVTSVCALVFWQLAPSWVALVLGAATLAVFSGGNWIVQSVFNAARQRGFVATAQVSEQWLKYALAFFLLLALPATGETVLMGQAAAGAVVLCGFTVLIRRYAGMKKSASSKEIVWQKAILDFSLPFAAWGAFTWAQIASDRWALAWRAGPEEVGLYSVVYQIGYAPMAMFMGLALQVAGPVFFEKAGLGKSRRRLEQARDGILRLTVIFCGITLAACAVLAVLGGLIMDSLVSHEYRAGAAYLPWLALAGGLFSAAQIYSIEFLANFKTALLAKVKILTAVAGVGLNFAGAFWFGIPGVIGAAILFSAMYFVCIIRLSVRIRNPHG